MVKKVVKTDSAFIKQTLKNYYLKTNVFGCFQLTYFGKRSSLNNNFLMFV